MTGYSGLAGAGIVREYISQRLTRQQGLVNGSECGKGSSCAPPSSDQKASKVDLVSPQESGPPLGRLLSRGGRWNASVEANLSDCREAASGRCATVVRPQASKRSLSFGEHGLLDSLYSARYLTRYIQPDIREKNDFVFG
jgi:hypothetical protein